MRYGFWLTVFGGWLRNRKSKPVPYLTARCLYLLLFTLGCSRMHTIPPAWQGDYTYDADFGRNTPGTYMGVVYQLHLHNKTCMIESEGYQTNGHFLCFVRPVPSGIDILFLSNVDGGKENVYDVEHYRANDTLFGLSLSPHNKVITTWGTFTLLDGNTPKPGVYFRLDKTSPAKR